MEVKGKDTDSVIEYVTTRREIPVFSGWAYESIEAWVELVESHWEATRYPQVVRSAPVMESVVTEA